MTLQNDPDGSLDLLVIDAFTSDAIPTHLLTREAFGLYAHKLSPGGLLAINVSNRYSNLEPVIATVAASQSPPWTAISRTDSLLTSEEQELGKSASQWIVLAERNERLTTIAEGQSWAKLTPRPGRRPWTDDWSNVLETLRWQSVLHSGD